MNGETNEIDAALRQEANRLVRLLLTKADTLHDRSAVAVRLAKIKLALDKK